MERRYGIAGSVVAALLVSGWSTAGEPAGKPLDMFGPEAAGVVTWTAFSEAEGTSLGDVWKVSPDEVVCRGTPKGYLRTEEDFTNFVLTLEWRWPGKPGNGGVLIRTTGPDKIWPKCLEAQLNTGGAGDFWGLDGYELAGPKDRFKSLQHDQFGKLANLRKTEDAEGEPGQWNRYEIMAQGGRVVLKINGTTVNETTDCEVLPGKICLTAEGDPIEFRNVRIRVLD